MLDVETLVFGGVAAPRRLRVLVVGADGFVGRAVAAALVRRGRAVVAAVRRPGHGAPLPACEVVEADPARDGRERWTARLRGVDAVVNAAGAEPGRPEAPHLAGEAELFLACAEAGVAQLVHVAAAGGEGAGGADALLSLARGQPGWHLLRPGLVIGRGGDDTAALLALSAGRRPVGWGMGAARLWPIHVGDLADLAADLALGAPAAPVLAAAGPRAMTADELSAALRAWLGLPPAPPLPMPAGALRVLLAPGLLARLRSGDAAPGAPGRSLRRPRPIGEAMALDAAGPPDRAAARAARARPALLAALAAAGIAAGAARLGITPALARAP